MAGADAGRGVSSRLKVRPVKEGTPSLLPILLIIVKKEAALLQA